MFKPEKKFNESNNVFNLDAIASGKLLAEMSEWERKSVNVTKHLKHKVNKMYKLKDLKLSTTVG